MNGQRSVLEGLYMTLEDIDESIYPQDEASKEHRKQKRELAEKIKESYSPEQFEMHEDYWELQRECLSDEVYKAYREGMYFGLRLMAESFLCREYDKE